MLCWLVGLLLFGFCFASSLCCDVCWLPSVWMLVSCHFLACAAASLLPLTIAHCFKTLGSNRFDGFLWNCRFFVAWSLLYDFSLLECVLARWLLDVSSQSNLLFPKQKTVVMFGARNCDLGGLVLPFWFSEDHFDTLGDRGSSRKDTRGSRIVFPAVWKRFWGPPSW